MINVCEACMDECIHTRYFLLSAILSFTVFPVKAVVFPVFIVVVSLQYGSNWKET